MRHAPMLALLLVGSLIAHATAKTSSGSVTLSSAVTEKFVSKFSGSASEVIKVSGIFHTDTVDYFDGHPHDMTLCLYKEQKWDAFQQALKKGSLCTERRQMASHSIKIHPALSPAQQARHEFSFQATLLPSDGFTAHYWFAVLMDCYLEEYDAHPPPMHYELKFLNGRSHLPADQDGMATVHGVLCVGMTAYGLFYFGRSILQMYQKGQVHLLILLFAAAYTMQTGGAFFEWLHLWHYRRDGAAAANATAEHWKGSLFDLVSGLLQCASELTISLVLIALAFGWTLGLDAQAPLQGHVGKLLAGLHTPGKLLRGLRSPSSLLLFSIAASQVALLGIGRSMAEGSAQSFHEFEHWPGVVLLCIRLVLCGVFVWALQRSRAVESNVEVLGFLGKLAWFGAVWFLCLPLLVLVATLLPPYRRHQLVAGGSILVQAAALVLLSTLFAEGSHFYRMSSLSHLGSGFAMGTLHAPARGAGIGSKIAID
jgi:hypothetical protein